MKAKSAEAAIRHPSHSSSVEASSKLPKTMRAVAIDRFGGPEVLTLHTLQVPALSEHEVLIGVDTAGVGSGTLRFEMARWIRVRKSAFRSSLD
jgi:hypothetical protein